MKNKSNSSDYVFLALFGIGGILIFSIQLIYPTTQPNPRETTLYTVLELGLSLGFGWVLQRIDSRKQYQESLKQFALSAYRRISDVEKSVKKIRGTIEEKRLAYPKDKIHELDILKIAAEELNNTVNSSILDWADIIGEEISKKERLEMLQIEQYELKSKLYTKPDSDEYNKRLDELRKEINDLRSDLPFLLKRDLSTASDFWSTPAMRVLEQYRREAISRSSITVLVKLFNYDHSLDIDKIKVGGPFSVVLDQIETIFRLMLMDKDGKSIGEITNPFEEFGQNDFVGGLLTVLDAVTSLNGTSQHLSFTKPLILKSASILRIEDETMVLTMPAKEFDFASG